jgi:Domain of unknown function (DUF4349)
MRPIVDPLLIVCLSLMGCTATPQGATDTEWQERFQPKDYSGTGVQGGVALLARADVAAPRSAPMPFHQKTIAAGDAPLFARSNVAAGMVIRTGQTSVEVDSLERAVSQVRLLAARVGGYVANTTMQTGGGQLRSANLEVKIPADRFDDGLGGLAALGKLESVNVNAEDVGEEFTDVTARMGNARRLEARLIELLATRTGKLTDVLDVEKELARVREEVDRYEGRLRYLRAHAALSTLSIYVHEPLPVVGHAGSSVIAEAFKQSWRNFVGLVAAMIRSLGIVIPVAVLVVALWVSAKRLSPLATRSAGR